MSNTNAQSVKKSPTSDVTSLDLVSSMKTLRRPKHQTKPSKDTESPCIETLEQLVKDQRITNSNMLEITEDRPSPQRDKLPSTPQREKIPPSTPQREKIPPSTPQREKIPPSTPQREKIPPSTPQREKIPPSTPQREKIPPSTPQREKIPPSTPQREKIPPSTPQREKIPPSTPQREKIPSSTPQREKIPINGLEDSSDDSSYECGCGRKRPLKESPRRKLGSRSPTSQGK
ncbi:actin cytoskeleton-regulatory complex protein pan1-like [Diaphorina citri]|uniref:Actin cytoskeleton-regulatory complex protein pan1-like n=1 Tax=Diaphorina citri TaxID=121845 RepID=A0A3Q0IJX5_DIACI|nr:actin cytoskeleton-regulatory complex protein pan1-like [Diaphorina citri]